MKRVEWIGAQARCSVIGENENLGEIEGRGGFKGKKGKVSLLYGIEGNVM
jgi:hypothetical protein